MIAVPRRKHVPWRVLCRSIEKLDPPLQLGIKVGWVIAAAWLTLSWPFRTVGHWVFPITDADRAQIVVEADRAEQVMRREAPALADEFYGPRQPRDPTWFDRDET